MKEYPNCPFCGNSNDALSIVDVEIGHVALKAIKCNNPSCGKYLGFYKDYDTKLNQIEEKIEDMKSDIDRD